MAEKTAITFKPLSDPSIQDYDSNLPVEIGGYQDQGSGNKLTNVTVSDLAGPIPINTYALLISATKSVGVIYQVTNDPDTTLINPPYTNNGQYTWNGSIITKVSSPVDGEIASGDVKPVEGGKIWIKTQELEALITANEEQIATNKLLAILAL